MADPTAAVVVAALVAATVILVARARWRRPHRLRVKVEVSWDDETPEEGT